MAFASKRAARRYQREWRAAQYLERKLAQKCVDCGSELAADDGVKCTRCDTAEKMRRAIAREEKPVLVRRERTRAKRYRRELLDAGKCIQCKAPRGEDGTKMRCRPCQSVANEVSATYKARVEARGTRKPIPIEEVLARPRVVLLRAMRFLPWSTSSEIFEAVGVSEARSSRDAYRQALVRLTQGRVVERRAGAGPKGMESAEYQLTERGRSAVARLLRGLELA